MKLYHFIKNPKAFIQNKANVLAEKIIRQQSFIPITETKENDIFIAGYPKSGNTWMKHLVTNILLETVSSKLSPRLVNEIVPDVHFKQYYKRFFTEMFFKTHDLPKPEYKRVIHLVRDGRDAMVSYYKMSVNMDKNYPYSLKDMVVDGKGIFPSKWHEHSRQWIMNPYKADIIVVKYEDLLLNPLDELKKICDFANISVTDEFLLKVIDVNNIKNLRNRVEKYGVENENMYKNKKATSFFRKGIKGDYKNLMSDELIDFFNKEADDELKYFGYI